MKDGPVEYVLHQIHVLLCILYTTFMFTSLFTYIKLVIHTSSPAFIHVICSRFLSSVYIYGICSVCLYVSITFTYASMFPDIEHLLRSRFRLLCLQISNTYYVPLHLTLNPTLPPGGLQQGQSTEYNQELTYYQWVPIILVFCAAMFAIPGEFIDWSS